MKIKYLIDNLISSNITAIPWVDRYAGIVQTMHRQELGKNNTTVTKKFPIACDATIKDCESFSIQQDLAPNDIYNSVVYWEEVTPMKNIGQTATKRFNEKRFKGVARLVVWINRAKLGLDACDSLAAGVLEIEEAASQHIKINGGVFDGSIVKIQPVGMVKHDINTIFGKYDYKIEKNWYLYPFDYFAIDFEFNITQCLKSGVTLTTGDREDCPNNLTEPCFSLLFDGVNEQIEAPVNSAFDLERNQAFSFEYWIKPTSFGAVRIVLSKWSLGRGYYTGTVNDSTILVLEHVGGAGFRKIQVSSTSVLPSNEWTHVIHTYDGSSTAAGVSIYHNGVPQGANILIDNLDDTIISPQPLRIGGSISGFNFAGFMNYVRGWKVELTAAEALQQYNNSINNVTPVQADDLIVNLPVGNGSNWDGSQFLTTDLTGITSGYVSQNMEQTDKQLDCP